MTAERPRITVMHVDTERGWRGGEQHVLWLARALERAGHRSVLGARPGEPLAQRAAELGLTSVACAPRSEFALLEAWRLRQAMARERVQVVHAHTAHAAALCALATLSTRTPLVITRHIDYKLRANPGTWWKYRRAAAIIAVSESVATSLAASGIDTARIEVIAGGVDLTDARALAPPSARATFGIPPDAPLAVMVASLVPQKDPLTFVRALARARESIPALHALLIGDGELRGQVESAIESFGLANVAHLAGFRQDADQLMGLADVVVLSSRNEGLPVTLMNALARGKPVVATAAGGIPEALRAGRCGLLAPVGDAERLGEMISRVLSDAALAHGLGEAGRAHAAEYGIDRVAERTAAVYARVLGRELPAR